MKNDNEQNQESEHPLEEIRRIREMHLRNDEPVTCNHCGTKHNSEHLVTDRS